jgi:hypothetical protein
MRIVPPAPAAIARAESPVRTDRRAGGAAWMRPDRPSCAASADRLTCLASNFNAVRGIAAACTSSRPLTVPCATLVDIGSTSSLPLASAARARRFASCSPSGRRRRSTRRSRSASTRFSAANGSFASLKTRSDAGDLDASFPAGRARSRLANARRALMCGFAPDVRIAAEPSIAVSPNRRTSGSMRC